MLDCRTVKFPAKIQDFRFFAGCIVENDGGVRANAKITDDQGLSVIDFHWICHVGQPEVPITSTNIITNGEKWRGHEDYSIIIWRQFPCGFLLQQRGKILTVRTCWPNSGLNQIGQLVRQFEFHEGRQSALPRSDGKGAACERFGGVAGPRPFETRSRDSSCSLVTSSSCSTHRLCG